MMGIRLIVTDLSLAVSAVDLGREGRMEVLDGDLEALRGW